MAAASPAINSIEEDLRLQRLRQQQRLEEVEKENKAKPFDPETGEQEELVVEAVPAHAEQLILKGAFPIQPFMHHFGSSLSLACVLEQSPSLNSRYRCSLRQIWHSKYLLEQVRVNQRASLLYCDSRRQLRWTDHSLPDGMFCAWDMACKHHLHASSRTFDIGLTGEDCLPTIATAVQGGLALLQQSREPQSAACTMRR
jgi:hypothetical protein